MRRRSKLCKIGQKYKITKLTSRRKGDYGNEFVGKVMWQNKKLLLLINDAGVRETFLKIDFVTRDYSCEVV